MICAGVVPAQKSFLRLHFLIFCCSDFLVTEADAKEKAQKEESGAPRPKVPDGVGGRGRVGWLGSSSCLEGGVPPKSSWGQTHIFRALGLKFLGAVSFCRGATLNLRAGLAGKRSIQCVR